MPARPSAQETRRAQDRLRALASEPAERAAFALELLATHSTAEVLAAAVAALEAHPLPAAREPLAALYRSIDAAGPKGDAGGFLRTAIVQALSASAAVERELYQRAASTFEPGPSDSSAPAILRAAGLIALSECDAARAAFEAVRLLADVKHTSRMSGEPAATAARVLASLGHQLVLYYVVLAEHSENAEVIAEAVRSFTALPPDLLPEVAALVTRTGSETVELGWCDLLLGFDDVEVAATWLDQFLRGELSPEVYRYAVTATIASRKLPLLGALLAAATDETRRYRIAILLDALPLAARQLDVSGVMAALQDRQ
jgi:hypothetical protein